MPRPQGRPSSVVKVHARNRDRHGNGVIVAPPVTPWMPVFLAETVLASFYQLGHKEFPHDIGKGSYLLEPLDLGTLAQVRVNKSLDAHISVNAQPFAYR